MSSGPLVYKVEDRSILLPYYRRLLVGPLLPLLPERLNPNTITHVGHLLNLTAAVLLLALWPKQGWPFAASALLLQLYVWCDNADGAHARRTNQCSPMGELLDHGLDALNTVYIGYLTAMALGLPPSGWVTITLIIPGSAAVTYWEQTTTGVFRAGLLNQIESCLVLASALLTSAIFGTGIWTELSLFGVTLQRAMYLWASITILFGMIRAASRVRAEAGGRAVLPILPLFAFGGAVAGAAAAGAISTITAVTLATCVNVYFGTKMLTFRLHHRLPRVELPLVAFAVVLCAFIAWRLTGHEVSPFAGPALATIACIVFGAQAIQDTRASLQQIVRVP
jgi:phosphatidylglycerophosphate synthase